MLAPVQVPNKAVLIGPPKTSKVPLGTSMPMTPAAMQIRQLGAQRPAPVPGSPAQPAMQAPAGQPAPVTQAPPQLAQPDAVRPPMIQPTMPVLKAPEAAPTPAPSSAMPQTAPVTGQETPYHVAPGMSDTLQGLLAKLTSRAGAGGGGDADISGALKRSAMDQIANPDVYGTDLMKGAMDEAKNQIDAQYGGMVQGVKNDLGARGLAYSGPIAGQAFNDVASQAGRAYQDMIRPLLRERAQSMGSARSAAFNNALNLQGDSRAADQQGFNQLQSAANLQGGVESGLRDEARGERAYTDSLDQNAYDRSMRERAMGDQEGSNANSQYMDALQMAIGAGNPSGAASILGSGAGYYGDQAAQGGDSLQQLAQMFMQKRAAA